MKTRSGFVPIKRSYIVTTETGIHVVVMIRKTRYVKI